MATLYVSNLGARAMVDALTARLNTGGAGLLRFYAGSVPADADAGLGGATLLSQHTLSNPAFAAATDANPGASAVANAIADNASANATGVATFCRLYRADGTTCEAQGDVGITGSGAFATLNSTSIQAGTLVQVTGLSLSHPES